MNGELFTIPKLAVSPLVAARALLATAELEFEHQDAGKSLCKSPEEWELWHAAEFAVRLARNGVAVEKNRELERLRAAREPA